MSLEEISVSIGGTPFETWHDVTINISAEEAVRTASISGHLPPEVTPPWPDSVATLSASGTLVLTGYVRDLRADQGDSNWNAEVSFVSRTIDAVEASIKHATGLAKNKDIKGIAKEFDSSGVGVEAVGTYDKIERHQIEPGESLFDTLEPLARSAGAIIRDTPEGKLRIVQKPEGTHAGGLSVGVNIISATVEFSGQGKFDPVLVRGQQSRGSGAPALRPEAQASDPSVGRYRPKIIILDNEATVANLKKRTEWHMRGAAGQAVSATIVVSGWRDGGGKLWEPNWQVYVRHPRIYLDQMMAIKSVVLSQDTRQGGMGTTATLTVVDPRALGGASSGAKSGKGWSAPEPKAEYRAE